MPDIVVIDENDPVSTGAAIINDNFAALQNCFRSATAPASPIAGQLWLDISSTNVLKIRNAANSAWVVLFADTQTASGGSLPLTGGTMSGAVAMGSSKITGLANGTVSGDAIHYGQAVGMTQVLLIDVGAVSATMTKLLAVCTGSMNVTAGYVVNQTTIATHASNYWTFTLSMQGGSNLQSSVLSTVATALTANTSTSLGVNQNNLAATLTAGSVLKLDIAKNGSATALADLVVALFVTVNP